MDEKTKKTKSKLVGIEVLLNKSGRLEVELSGLPLEDVDKHSRIIPTSTFLEHLLGYPITG